MYLLVDFHVYTFIVILSIENRKKGPEEKLFVLQMYGNEMFCCVSEKRHIEKFTRDIVDVIRRLTVNYAMLLLNYSVFGEKNKAQTFPIDKFFFFFFKLHL